MAADSRNHPVALAAALAALAALAACGKEPSQPASTADAPAGNAAETAAADPAAAPAAGAPAAGAPAAGAPAPDNTETLTGVQLASFTGDAAAGAKVFVQCKTCHVTDAGVNRVGPSLHAVVGRTAGSVPGYTYSPANKNSGITWSEAKLFQYLEKPQRVVPGTKMAFPGIADPQKRADLIAYLKNPS